MGSALASPLLLASVTISITCSRARRMRWNTAFLLIRADSQSGCLRHVWGEKNNDGVNERERELTATCIKIGKVPNMDQLASGYY